MQNTHQRQVVAIVLTAFAVAGGAAFAESPTAAQAKQLVKNSLKYVDGAGMEWREQQGCLSCHRVSFTVWTLNRAHEQGFAVDRKRLSDWNAWATDWVNMVKPDQQEKAEREKTLLGQNDTIGQLLLGRPKADAASLEWAADYRKHLVQAQNDDGSWKAGGQLPTQKRPGRETKEVSTMWSLLALLEYPGEEATPDKATPDEAVIKKAKDWLGDKTKGESVEWWVVKMLLARQTGNHTEADQLRRQLLEMQQEDGGWGWLITDPSDAFGAGLAIYGLVLDGLAPQDPQLVKGIQFLSREQREDGSWKVHGTKKNGRSEEVETAVYWGACWAVIGTLEWLDRVEGT